jgi:hypothetical protein
MITKEEDIANTIALLRLARDGYKNSAAALAARVAELEAGGPDARVKELTAELDKLRSITEAQQAQLTKAAHDAAHKKESNPDLAYYMRRVRHLEATQDEILKILGHDPDSDYDYD